MQLMPATAAGLGVTDPFDPMQSLMRRREVPAQPARRSTATSPRRSRATTPAPARCRSTAASRPTPRRRPTCRRCSAFFEQYGGLRDRRPGGPAAADAHQAGIPAGYARSASAWPQAAGARPARAPPAATRTAPRRGRAALSSARPYRLGRRAARDGFDCSGLMQYAYRQQGVQIPRVAADQFRAGQAGAARAARSPATSSSSPTPATSTTWDVRRRRQVPARAPHGRRREDLVPLRAPLRRGVRGARRVRPEAAKTHRERR